MLASAPPDWLVLVNKPVTHVPRAYLVRRSGIMTFWQFAAMFWALVAVAVVLVLALR